MKRERKTLNLLIVWPNREERKKLALLSTSVKAELLRLKGFGEKLKGIKVTSDD